MIESLSIKNLRILKMVELALSEGENIFWGPNGAGKTTILEAVQLLATGRSVRHREVAPLITEGERDLEIVAVFHDDQGMRHVLGTKRSRDEAVVRLDGRKKVRRSEILQLFPVHWIGPNGGELIQGEPKGRRGFIDAGLFHVEHAHLQRLQQYHRVLEQRNAALRIGDRGFYHWDNQLGDLGVTIDRARRRYLAELETTIRNRLASWDLGITVDFNYRRGWPSNEPFPDALVRRRARDYERGFTGCGPHRADWLVEVRTVQAAKTASRGQLKMVAAACHLAQAVLMKERVGRIPTLLFDDPTAELDKTNRIKLLRAIQKVYQQVMMTVLDPEDLPIQRGRMFHVEQGVCTPS